MNLSVKHQHIVRMVDKIAAASSSLLGHTIFIATCYFIVIFIIQIMLFMNSKVWFETMCSLHSAMTETRNCYDYVSSISSFRHVVAYAATELNIMVLIAGSVCLLSAMKGIVGVLRDRLTPTLSKASADVVTSSGM